MKPPLSADSLWDIVKFVLKKNCDTGFPFGNVFMLLRTRLGFVCSSGFVDLLLFHFGDNRAIWSNSIKLWETHEV